MEYTTSEGRIVPLRRVTPRYVDQIRAKHTIPELPTYSFVTKAGVTVTLPHDEESVKQSGPEAAQVWSEYQTARRVALQDQEQEVIEFLMYHCITEDPPPVSEWSVDFKLHGLEPPDDSNPIQFKVAWVQSEIILNEEQDYPGLLTRLYEMGGLVDSAKALEFEGFFRLIMERLATTARGGAAR